MEPGNPTAHPTGWQPADQIIFLFGSPEMKFSVFRPVEKNLSLTIHYDLGQRSLQILNLFAEKTPTYFIAMSSLGQVAKLELLLLILWIKRHIHFPVTSTQDLLKLLNARKAFYLLYWIRSSFY